jgi:phenylacetic acid degradation operon negative regulatory protein
MINTAEEILIYLEDQKESSFKQFPIKNSRKLRGALGRLQSWKYIKKIIQDKQSLFSLTALGEKVIDKILSELRTQKSIKAENFYLIIYNIKESQRDLREKLRKNLTDLGATIFHSGVWISSSDITQEIKKITYDLKISDKVLILKTQISKEIQKKLVQIWDLDEINKNYLQFIKDAQSILNNKILENKSYQIKRLIFNFALNLKKDPQLPSEFSPTGWKKQEAFQTYLKLRKLLV